MLGRRKEKSGKIYDFIMQIMRRCVFKRQVSFFPVTFALIKFLRFTAAMYAYMYDTEWEQQRLCGVAASSTINSVIIIIIICIMRQKACSSFYFFTFLLSTSPALTFQPASYMFSRANAAVATFLAMSVLRWSPLLPAEEPFTASFN